jgi:hypothetical protein
MIYHDSKTVFDNSETISVHRKMVFANPKTICCGAKMISCDRKTICCGAQMIYRDSKTVFGNPTIIELILRALRSTLRKVGWSHTLNIRPSALPHSLINLPSQLL